jgi:hypothetical protein
MTAPTPLQPRDNSYDIALANRASFRPGFLAWLAENAHVWLAFKREADRIWDRGRRHYSARTIGEVLRHESVLADNSIEWKLNDHCWPDLARLYLLVNPQRSNFFELRGKSKLERAA